MNIKVYRYSVPDEAAALRQEVFVDEQGFIDEFDEFDSKSVHLVMFDDGEAIATLRFYDEGGKSAHIGRVAVKSSRRGEGLGRVLMENSFGILRSEGMMTATVGAQEDKAGFYERCGFVRYGERYFEQDYPHVNMRIDL